MHTRVHTVHHQWMLVGNLLRGYALIERVPRRQVVLFLVVFVAV